VHLANLTCRISQRQVGPKGRTNHETSQDWPFVSVVLINMNGMRWLDRCLNSVLESDYPSNRMEIILVDNGSTDGSVESARDICGDSRIKIIQNKTNVGWSPANNQGVRIASGEIVVCLSNDMVVDSLWLATIVNTMKLSPYVGIVQCNSISMWDRKSFDSCMNFLDKYGFAYSYAPQTRPRSVFFAEGMAFAIRSHVFNEIGGFDDYYFMEYDDMDLSWRAHLAGYKVFFCPTSIVYHARGGTVGGTYFVKNTKNIVQYVRNHFVTLIKNYSTSSLLQVLPVLFSVQCVKVLFFIRRRNPRLITATLKGMLLALKDAKLVMRKRNEVQYRVRKVPDKEVLLSMHPFRPRLLQLFIASQAEGRKLVLNSYPPAEIR
jgi:GT2 family glycosyltransferase